MVLEKKGKGHEQEHARREEVDFKVMARRNRLLGEWLAGKFGLTGDEVSAYAKEVVIADLDEPGDEDVVRKVMADIQAKGADVGEDAVRAKLEELLAVARGQLATEG